MRLRSPIHAIAQYKTNRQRSSLLLHLLYLIHVVNPDEAETRSILHPATCIPHPVTCDLYPVPCDLLKKVPLQQSCFLKDFFHPATLRLSEVVKGLGNEVMTEVEQGQGAFDPLDQ
jgi:hypothetical protein